MFPCDRRGHREAQNSNAQIRRFGAAMLPRSPEQGGGNKRRRTDGGGRINSRMIRRKLERAAVQVRAVEQQAIQQAVQRLIRIIALSVFRHE